MMIKKSFTCMAFALCAMFSFVACSDDDDDNELTAATAAEMAGSYVGDMDVVVTVMGGVVTLDPQTTDVTIVANDDATATVTIKDFSYNGTNYGNIVVQGVEMKELKSDGTTAVEGTSDCTLTKDGNPYTATTTLVGTFAKETKLVKFDCDMSLPVSARMTILFKINVSAQPNTAK